MASRRELAGLLAVALVATVVSGIDPLDRATWLLEVAPVLLVVPILVGTRGRFPLTRLAYRLGWGTWPRASFRRSSRASCCSG